MQQADVKFDVMSRECLELAKNDTICFGEFSLLDRKNVCVKRIGIEMFLKPVWVDKIH